MSEVKSKEKGIHCFFFYITMVAKWFAHRPFSSVVRDSNPGSEMFHLKKTGITHLQEKVRAKFVPKSFAEIIFLRRIKLVKS